MPKTEKKTRISKLAQCLRNGAATIRLKKNAMPDNRVVNTELLTKETSAKFVKLIENIQKLDQEDLRNHGKLYKHFIFTDIRQSAHGAKAVASFLIANGFDFRMGLEKKLIKRHGELVETKTGETVFVDKEEPNGFAILQSLPLWKNPLSVKTKKDILRVFNSRPENVHGQRLRIIVLDSKYKEGIDLFDVKYVHLLEPPLANSDLKQAIGRATRFCGQKGLQFIPNKGWPLEVYIYTLMLPNVGTFKHGEGETVDAHDLLMAKSGLDLALLHLVNELTVLAIRSSVDYDLNFKINNFDMEEALQAAVVAEVVLPEEQQGGAPKLVSIHDMADVTPALLQKCFKRKSKLFPFSRARMEHDARRLHMKIPKGAKRSWFCEQLRVNPEFLESLLQPEVDMLSVKALHGSVQNSLSNTNSTLSSAPTSLANSVSSFSRQSRPNTASNEALLRVRTLFPSPIDYMPSIQDFFESKEAEAELYQRIRGLKNKTPLEFQREIMELYGKFRWASPVVKNGCEQPFAQQKSVTFTKTQDFVRHYLVPDSPFKGLLAWHSVGTGKTCMAVAAATTQFEQAGYTIVWVTRNSLMADVYKNIFGSVCSIPIMEKIEKGATMPQDFTKQKRMLSKAWLPPISYRTFQNALEGKNELGRLMKAKHADPLHKTFLIMDEIHKLQDGDLGGNEAADFSVIQRFIHNSYAVSKNESVRPLLMTATPITDSPRELFDLLNTLIEKEEDRLTPFQTFRETFTDEEGTISQDGKEYFLQKAKGLISYLNREFDPTTFAQPVFHKIQVPLEGKGSPSAADIADMCGVEPNVEEPEGENLSKKELRQRKRNRTQRLKEKKAQIKACYNQTKKEHKTKGGQIETLEKCFGSKQTFPSLREVMAQKN